MYSLRCTPKPIEHARAREGHKGEEGSASSPRPSSPRWARHGERSLRSLRGSSPTRPRILLGSRFASRRTIGPFSFSFWALSARRRLPGGGMGLRRNASCGARVAREGEGIWMKGIKKDGTKSFNVRMSECQNVSHDESEKARGVSGCHRSGTRDGGGPPGSRCLDGADSLLKNH